MEITGGWDKLFDCSSFSAWSNLTSLKITCGSRIQFPRLPKLRKLDLSVSVPSAPGGDSNSISVGIEMEKLRTCMELYSHSLIHLVLPTHFISTTDDTYYYNLLIDPDHGVAKLKKLTTLEFLVAGSRSIQLTVRG